MTPQSINQSEENLTLKKITKIISVILLAISIIQIIHLLLTNKSLTFINSEATMKFNTAFVFFLCGIKLMLINKKNTYHKNIKKFISLLIILIGTLSLVSGFGFSFLNIDNLIIIDNVQSGTPGLMSLATAFCSVLTGLIFITYSSSKKNFIKIQKISNSLVFIVSFLALISYLLLIPMEQRPRFIDTMSLQTSLLFVLISTLFLLKNKDSIYNQYYLGKYLGNITFRKMAPKIIIEPIVIGNILLLLIDLHFLNTNLAIINYTFFLIVSRFISLSFVADFLNKIDKEKISLQEVSEHKNQNLTILKKAIDTVSSVVITDTEGKVKYINDYFTLASQYTKEDVIGNKYSITNSNYHDSVFYENLWNTIKSGKVWVGDIRNKKKDGTLYWVHSSIFPIRNDDGTIKEFMFLDRVINTP